ncbi:MAG TPA: hypothetical protein VNU21_09655 [Usitatibacter sp.]|nr:hypothetical protein [Usitatibacter sp.]
MIALANEAGVSGWLAQALRRAGSSLLAAANRLEQRTPLTLALEPLAPVAPVEESIADVRLRNSRYY